MDRADRDSKNNVGSINRLQVLSGIFLAPDWCVGDHRDRRTSIDEGTIQSGSSPPSSVALCRPCRLAPTRITPEAYLGPLGALGLGALGWRALGLENLGAGELWGWRALG